MGRKKRKKAKYREVCGFFASFVSFGYSVCRSSCALLSKQSGSSLPCLIPLKTAKNPIFGSPLFSVEQRQGREDRRKQPVGLPEGSRGWSGATPPVPRSQPTHPGGVPETSDGRTALASLRDAGTTTRAPGVSSRQALLHPRLPSGIPPGNLSPAEGEGDGVGGPLRALRLYRIDGRGIGQTM